MTSPIPQNEKDDAVHYGDESSDAMLHRIRTAASVSMSPELFGKALHVTPERREGRASKDICQPNSSVSKSLLYNVWTNSPSDIELWVAFSSH